MKYRNKPCEIDGLKLDSQLELQAYEKIKHVFTDSPYIIKRHRPITILSEFESKNAKLKAVTWRPDFGIYHKDSYSPSLLIECKGFETPEFLLKMNMLGRLSYWQDTVFVYGTATQAEGSKMAKCKARVTFPGKLDSVLRQIVAEKFQHQQRR